MSILDDKMNAIQTKSLVNQIDATVRDAIEETLTGKRAIKKGDKGYVNKVTQRAKLMAAKSMKPDFIFGETEIAMKKNNSQPNIDEM